MMPLLLILIFLRPFICSLAFPFANYYYSLFLAAFLGIWLVYKRSSWRNIGPLIYPLFFFAAALLIALFCSKDRTNSLSELYKYFSGVLLLLIGASLKEEAKERLISVMTLGALCISILAIYQYFFGFGHIINYLKAHSLSSSFTLDFIRQNRAFFPFVTPNILAGYLAMSIPLTLPYRSRRWIALILFCALILTKSLGGSLSIFAGLVVYFSLQNDFKKERVILLIGLLAAMGALFLIRTGAAAAHTQPLFSSLMRTGYWRNTLSIIKDSFLTGVGPGNFNLPQSRYAHNSYLQLWAETGILGIISFLWIVAAAAKSGLAKIILSPHKEKCISLAAASAAFLAHNLVDFSFFLPEVSLVWWVIVGLLIAPALDS